MADWMSGMGEWVWRGAVIATVPVLLIALLARFVPARPATRHSLWVIALLWFAAAPFVPAAPFAWRLPAGKTESPPALRTLEISAPCEESEQAVAPEQTVAPASRRCDPKSDAMDCVLDPSRAVPSHSAENSNLIDKPNDAPTPPRTDARTIAGAPPSLAQAACEGGRRSHSLDSPTAASLLAPASVNSDFASRLAFGGNDLQSEFKTGGDDDALLPGDAMIWQQVPSEQLERRPLRGATDLSPPAIPLLFDFDLSPLRRFASALPRMSRAALDWLLASAPLVWMCGVVLLLVARLAACGRFFAKLSPISKCPEGITDMVAQAARDVGLSHPPRTVLVSNRISPMICCIGRRMLLLPGSLWPGLNDSGRKAVLYHELAHLKRGDHWVRWGEILISTLYWWHPAVWWVRRGLSEEAENCCDAWVTWLLPKGRRAYAQALLKTSAFISGGEAMMPAVGIGVTRVRARRFARRLTMVMTETTRPRLSTSGVALAALFATLGWFVTPAWSHPKDDTTPATEAAPAPDEVSPTLAEEPPTPLSTTPSLALGDVINLLQGGDAVLQDSVTVVDDDDDADDEEEVAAEDEDDDRDSDDDEDDDDADVDDRLERLERRLEALSASLHGGAVTAPRGVSAPARVPAISVRTPRPDDGEKVARSYHVSNGKLQALVSLMARNDVPIMVSGGDDSITVTATPDEHRVFEAFVHMIDPDGRSAAALMPAPPSPPRAVTGVRIPRAPRAPRASSQSLPETGVRSFSSDGLSDSIREEVKSVMKNKEKLLAEADELRHVAETAKDKVKAELLLQADQLRQQAQELARQASKMASKVNQDKLKKYVQKELRAKVGKLGQDDDGDDDDSDVVTRAESGNSYAKGYELHMKGRYEQAIELFKKSAAANQSKGASLYNIACGYARLGQKDKAFEYLRKAWDSGYQDVDHMRDDEDLNSLHGDKRYKELVGGEDE